MDDEGVIPEPTRLSSTRALYVISVAAELAGMHPQTLRFYERKGLVEPSRTGGGNRRYSEADIVRLRRIASLTASGLNLEGAKRILGLEAELDRVRSELARVATEAREAVERTHRYYRRDLVPVRQATVLWQATGTGRRQPGSRRRGGAARDN